MSRLASFRGPSTPSSSPAQQVKHRQNQGKSTPNSPSKQAESTYHRKVRTCLQEIRSVTETWEDIVLLDGLKSLKKLVDTRTDLDNELAQTPNRLPRAHIVAPKLEIMDQCIISLDAVITKLQKQFRKLNSLVETLESILVEAHKAKGWQWVHEEPLWVTWPLEKFVTSLSDIVIPYHRSLDSHTEIVDSLRSHSVSFEESRDAVSQWVAQPWLQEESWEAKWEEICDAEVHRWESA
ncbi:hypothetical protein NP233_g1683 [Leucocoprinus birnbaumii]|uniref:Uncharacterized protein n=1 Tax=Leucocoprinus birnbaumii TaxID=56174 RepID=A0AAD5W248_9AGAR|nr:hypothetical protein NP233_g1683 [Leucocoprinus birnbaumii]